MSEQNPVVLLTRPRPASERFAEALAARIGVAPRVVISPLLGIVPMPDARDDISAGAAIFTSANAVAAARPLGLPAFCVGEATTRAALRAGWQAVCLGENAEALIDALARNPPGTGPLMHLRGRHQRTDIAGRLTARGIACTDRVLYDQRLIPLNSEAQDCLAGPDPVIAPLFSPRTARQFAETAQSLDRVYAVALSPAVADCLKTRALGEVICAARPDTEAMVDAISPLWARLCRVEGNGGAQ